MGLEKRLAPARTNVPIAIDKSFEKILAYKKIVANKNYQKCCDDCNENNNNNNKCPKVRECPDECCVKK